MIHYRRRLIVLLGDLGLLQRITRGLKVTTGRLLRQGLLGERVDFGTCLLNLLTSLRDRRTSREQRRHGPH
jgi:hypothetical protein